MLFENLFTVDVHFGPHPHYFHLSKKSTIKVIGGTKVNTQSNLTVFALKTSLLLYCTKLSQFTYPTNTVKDISPEGGLNLTVCSSLHKTDWEAKPDQSVLITVLEFVFHL